MPVAPSAPTNSPLAASIVPRAVESSFSLHVAVSGTATFEPELSAPTAENFTVEPGVYNSLLGESEAWSKMPVDFALETTISEPRVGLSTPSEGLF